MYEGVENRKRDAQGGHALVYSLSKEEGSKWKLKAHVRLCRERQLVDVGLI